MSLVSYSCSSSGPSGSSDLNPIIIESSNENISIHLLPPEMLSKIFTYLGRDEKCAAYRVCHTWRNLMFYDAKIREGNRIVAFTKCVAERLNLETYAVQREALLDMGKNNEILEAANLIELRRLIFRLRSNIANVLKDVSGKDWKDLKAFLASKGQLEFHESFKNLKELVSIYRKMDPINPEEVDDNLKGLFILNDFENMINFMKSVPRELQKKGEIQAYIAISYFLLGDLESAIIWSPNSEFSMVVILALKWFTALGNMSKAILANKDVESVIDDIEAGGGFEDEYYNRSISKYLVQKICRDLEDVFKVCMKRNSLDSAFKVVKFMSNEYLRKPHLLNRLGEAYLQKEKLTEAFAVVQEMADKKDAESKLLHGLAEAYLQRNNPSQACEVLDRMPCDYSEKNSLLQELMEVQSQQEQEEKNSEVLCNIEKMIDEIPDIQPEKILLQKRIFEEYLTMKNLPKVHECAMKLPEANGEREEALLRWDEACQSIYAQAMQYIEKEEYDEAVAFVRRHIPERDKQHDQILIDLVHTCLEKGDLDKASEVASTLINHPQFLTLMQEICIKYIKIGEIDKSKKGVQAMLISKQYLLFVPIVQALLEKKRTTVALWIAARIYEWGFENGKLSKDASAAFTRIYEKFKEATDLHCTLILVSLMPPYKRPDFLKELFEECMEKGDIDGGIEVSKDLSYSDLYRDQCLGKLFESCLKNSCHMENGEAFLDKAFTILQLIKFRKSKQLEQLAQAFLQIGAEDKARAVEKMDLTA